MRWTDCDVRDGAFHRSAMPMHHARLTLDDITDADDLPRLAFLLVVTDTIRDDEDLAAGMVMPREFGVRQELRNGDVGTEELVGFVQFREPRGRCCTRRGESLASEEVVCVLRVGLVG